MDIRRRAGANIQRLRKARGWSQEELAERAGVHRTWVSAVERGVQNITITALEKFVVALGVGFGDLLDQ